MIEVMNKIVEMSVQASFVICVILILRAIFLKLNVPKRLIYVLWAIPLFRLVCPAAIASSFSIVPWVHRSQGDTTGSWSFDYRGLVGSSGSVGVMSTWQKPDDSVSNGVGNVVGQTAGINGGVETAGTVAGNTIVDGQMINPGVSDVGVTGNGLTGIESLLSGQFWQEISLWLHDPNNVFIIVWIVGIAILLGYSIVASIRLRRKLVGSVGMEQNCYRADHIKTPFVLGMINPKIYIPASLSDDNLEMIIQHEKMHIRRKDHVIKVLVFVVTCIYWFNPLVWVMYAMFCRDMESAVDEKVIANFDQEERQTYASLLLALHTDRRHLLAAPLAFGEGNVKGRIKHVVKYKKPVTILVIVAVIIAVVVALGLITSTKYAIPENAEATVEASAKGGYVQDGENFLSEEDAQELMHILRNTKLQWTFHTSTDGISDDFYDVWIRYDGNTHYLMVDSDTAYWQVDNRLYKVASPETIYMFLDSVSPVETLHTDLVIPGEVSFSKGNSVEFKDMESSDMSSQYRLNVTINSFKEEDFSKELTDEVTESWNDYRAASEEEREQNTGNWGSGTHTFDSWEECVAYVGVPMANPFEDAQEITPAVWVGKEVPEWADDAHCVVGWIGSEATPLESVHSYAGYQIDDIWVSLKTTVYGYGNTYEFITQKGWNQLASFYPEEISLLYGSKAVLVTTSVAGDSAVASIHFVDKNVLYELSVTGSEGEEDVVTLLARDLFSKFDLGGQPVSLDMEALQSRTYAETPEDIYQFGCDFVQYYVNSVVNKESIPSFDKYIDYDTYMDLALYVELMQQASVRQMVAGLAPMPYSKNIEFSQGVDVVELGAHRYKVIVEYGINGSNSAVHMLVRYQHEAPKIENICFDQKDSVDAIVIGSLNKHDITNFNKWLDTEWTTKVLDDMYAYGDKLLSIIQEKGIPYYSGIGDYYQDEDGMWVWNGNKYYYRLVLGGPNVIGDSAMLGSIYVVLSNDLNITYERARMASGLSSSMADYFDPAYAKVVGWQHYDKQNPDMVPFTYNGDDSIMRSICNYMIATDYSSNMIHDNIQVPAPIILKIDDADPSDIKVWGNFWSHTYKIEGQTLVSNGGGEWPCLMHLAKSGDQYVITRIDRVGDGSYYTEDLKRICKGQPGLYQQFLKTNGTDKTKREEIRQEFLRSYISYYAIDIDSYQDYGWDKIYFE